MPADGPFTPVLALLLLVHACMNQGGADLPSQELYDLHFPDGREVIGVKGGLSSCLDAFQNNVRPMSGENVRPMSGEDEGVCVSQKEGGSAFHLHFAEKASQVGASSATGVVPDGKPEFVEIGRDVLPPWALGSFYNFGWGMK